MKKKRYWLRGGNIFLCIYLLFAIVTIIGSLNCGEAECKMLYSLNIVFPMIFIFGSQVLSSFLVSFIGGLLIEAIISFIVGLFFGKLYEYLESSGFIKWLYPWKLAIVFLLIGINVLVLNLKNTLSLIGAAVLILISIILFIVHFVNEKRYKIRFGYILMIILSIIHFLLLKAVVPLYTYCDRLRCDVKSDILSVLIIIFDWPLFITGVFIYQVLILLLYYFIIGTIVGWVIEIIRKR